MQKLCRAILFIGFSVQIVLGICWMVMNFPYVQMFGESALYVEISKNLICDEYEGILYPVVILLARGIEEIFPIPYYCILYLLQLGVAFWAGYQFLQCVGIKKKMLLIWGGMALVTFPMVLQCHLAVLPDSLVASFVLLELVYSLRVVLNRQQLCAVGFVKVLSFWLLTALLQPEYLYLGAVPVMILFVYGIIKAWKKQKKVMLYNGILLMAFVGMIVGMWSLTQIDGYYGRAHQSFSAMMASRCIWPYVNQDYEFWPEEVKAQISWSEAKQIDYYADNTERILGRILEEALGMERTEELLGVIAKQAWQAHRNAIVHDAAWDVVGYTFSPLVVQRQLTGKAYDSYSGRNYDIMRMNTPQLAEYFLNYSCWWFAVGLGVAVLAQLAVLIREKRSFWNVEKVIVFIGWILTVLGMVLYYTMRGAGRMDYKKGIAITLLWIVWMLAVNLRGVRK